MILIRNLLGSSTGKKFMVTLLKTGQLNARTVKKFFKDIRSSKIMLPENIKIQSSNVKTAIWYSEIQSSEVHTGSRKSLNTFFRFFSLVSYARHYKLNFLRPIVEMFSNAIYVMRHSAVNTNSIVIFSIYTQRESFPAIYVTLYALPKIISTITSTRNILNSPKISPARSAEGLSVGKVNSLNILNRHIW